MGLCAPGASGIIRGVTTTAGALTCPQCGGALSPPSRFARDVVCTFCGSTVRLDPSVVSVARFREAHARWVRPSSHGFSEWVTIGDQSWAPLRVLGRGALADVILARRARPPSEHAVVMLLRDDADRARFDAKAAVLTRLRDEGGGHFVEQLPSLLARGVVSDGHARGRAALVLRWSGGFTHGLVDVRRAFPGGVSPEIGTWMWRRVLELLAHVHRLGLVHGAILPEHLLAHGREHAVRLVGFGRAAAAGTSLGAIDASHAPFFPTTVGRLAPALDVAMSARVVAWLLGGDPTTGETPSTVPRPLADVIAEVAGSSTSTDAWALRERVGDVARRTLGPPSFHPLSMP